MTRAAGPRRSTPRAAGRLGTVRPARRAPAALLLCMALLLAGCEAGGDGDKDTRRASDVTCDGRIDAPAQITMWYHRPSARGELEALRAQVRAFNTAQDDVTVRLVHHPKGDHDELVREAAADGELPDLLDFDAPKLFSHAWAGDLRPIDSCVPKSLRADLLPSVLEQGTYRGRLWGLGTFDSGLGLYVRPSELKKAGVRIPRGVGDAWTADEFTGILKKLRAHGHERPLDLQLQWADTEWGTYGFAPALWSAGGDLIDRSTYRTADGVLNGPRSVQALTTLQGWVKTGYVDANKDFEAFQKGRTPVSWAGHWSYGRYTEAHPGDVAIVPLPDFGTGSATGMGSWQWGIPAGTADGDAVWRFLDFLLRPEEILRMTEANGAIPATGTAIERTDAFAEGGRARLYIEQLRTGTARPRPQTPAYPAITEAFSHAFAKIMRGGAVRPALDEAVRAVDQDLADHGHYPPTGP
ncbi:MULTISPECIES: ABC transporter substrate-binding protein [Streptomyces]|uniref:Multiple sugar transport system substrate-binding protein n=1 Tax=Streptomyces stelliscabiei TaxID=146820 RepID=A0A8I0P122_9ACTN|nr:MULTISPECIES: extracellular solute-binding protein [Streptomyces]KND41452.1 substrate-binding transporter [Streptomyces stelliscabiei]MBE1596245.1 multiple sugar transport system substrate-binding protein [Streptomyces stelliscabiei]MDX2518060.1 extracellular solute-binding protein [Streptomyces stelliscabiei]SOD78553.1 carbohydrate ABC transporter substrate-binding protein, CUT1 family [Streptomyces sp. 1222.2]